MDLSEIKTLLYQILGDTYGTVFSYYGRSIFTLNELLLQLNTLGRCDNAVIKKIKEHAGGSMYISKHLFIVTLTEYSYGYMYPDDPVPNEIKEDITKKCKYFESEAKMEEFRNRENSRLCPYGHSYDDCKNSDLCDFCSYWFITYKMTLC